MMLIIGNNAIALVEERDCRVCHSSGLPDRHHLLVIDEGYECTDCHPDVGKNNVTIMDRNCLICHPIPPDINHVSNCTDCHLEGGSHTNWSSMSLSYTGFFNSAHYNITGTFNASNYSQISRVCWGCHLGYEEQLITAGHSKNRSQLPVCEDCHFNDTPFNSEYLRKKPIQIPEHQPQGEDIQTDYSTNCSFCHNNSLSIPVPTVNITSKRALNYVSHYVNTAFLINTTDCRWCHIDNADNVSWGKPTNPMTSDKLNHIPLNIHNSSGCYPCHISSKILVNGTLSPDFTFHDESMAPGAGKDCVSCHDIDGMVRDEFQIDVGAMNKSDAIHYNLNRGAAVTLNSNNVRCWACHGDGDGSEAAQPQGHPLNFRNPRNCSQRDCHNVNQSSFNEPMIYEHFKYVDEIDEDITTAVNCPACHLNSIMNYQDTVIPSNTSLVSHYGSTDDLINTSSCIYCHLDEDNSEDWGNAPDPTDNISRFSDKDWEHTLFVGDTWHLGNNYLLTFYDIADDGDSAYLQLYQSDRLLEEILVSEHQNFIYEDDFIDSDGDEVTEIAIELNFTKAFMGSTTGLVKVEARPWKRIHPEDKDPACWACHVDDHTAEKVKYVILDEDEDRIYYVEKLLDYSDEDVQDKVLLTSRSLMLQAGFNQTLQINGNFALTVKEIDVNGKTASIMLTKNGSVLEENIYREGEYVEHEKDLSYDGHHIYDYIIFRARVDKIFHGLQSDVVILTDVKVFSDQLIAIDHDEILEGYNTSQLHINDTVSVGGSPDTFHVPLLNEGLDGGSDCVYCHDASNGFGVSAVNAIQTRLGGHKGLNTNAKSSGSLTDDINKACWACHGDGTDPGRHPAQYLSPRQCKDCHVDLEQPTFGAVELHDEAHGQIEDCNRCHGADYPGLHVINVFEPLTPYVLRVNVTPEIVGPGQLLKVDFIAMAGWNMKIGAIEYFLDMEGPPGTGIQVMPRDSTFDEQVEEAEFFINTTGLEPGNHTIYVHSMERDKKWGPMNKAVFSIHQSINTTYELVNPIDQPVMSFQIQWWMAPLVVIIFIITVIIILGLIFYFKNRMLNTMISKNKL